MIAQNQGKNVPNPNILSNPRNIITHQPPHNQLNSQNTHMVPQNQPLNPQNQNISSQYIQTNQFVPNQNTIPLSQGQSALAYQQQQQQAQLQAQQEAQFQSQLQVQQQAQLQAQQQAQLQAQQLQAQQYALNNNKCLHNNKACTTTRVIQQS